VVFPALGGPRSSVILKRERRTKTPWNNEGQSKGGAGAKGGTSNAEGCLANQAWKRKNATLEKKSSQHLAGLIIPLMLCRIVSFVFFDGDRPIESRALCIFRHRLPQILASHSQPKNRKKTHTDLKQKFENHEKIRCTSPGQINKNYFPSSKSRIHNRNTFEDKKPALIHKEWDFWHFNGCSSYPHNVEERIQECW
jgi:hypothetical protein